MKKLTNKISYNNRAYAFIRVSSKGQEQNTSFRSQDDEVKLYCKENDLEIVKCIQIVETAYRGKKRTAYYEFIEEARRIGVQNLVFHRQDRESRNLSDLEKIEDFINEGVFKVHYVLERKTYDSTTPSSEFMNRDLKGAIDKHYSRENGEKMRRGYLAKSRAGWFPYRIPPLGYCHLREKNERGWEKRRGTTIGVSSNDQEVRQVQREFELRAERTSTGAFRSYEEIRKIIIGEGFINPKKINQYRSTSIQRRLENIFYDCRFSYDNTEYQGLHPRIISEELFWKVQETFGLKNKYRASNATFGGGWLKCADINCGCNIVYDPKRIRGTDGDDPKNFYHHYHCTNGKKVHSTMKGMVIHEHAIWDQLGHAVASISITEGFAKQIADALNEVKLRGRNAIKKQAEGLDFEMQRLQEQENKLLDLLIGGNIDKETYDNRLKQIRSTRTWYLKELERLNLQINDISLETAKSILELATNAESLWKSAPVQERKEFLNKILSNKTLDGLTVRYELKKPFETLSRMSGNVEWRIRRKMTCFTYLPNPPCYNSTRS